MYHNRYFVWAVVLQQLLPDTRMETSGSAEMMELIEIFRQIFLAYQDNLISMDFQDEQIFEIRVKK